MSSAKRISERVASPFQGCRVNRTAGTIDDVLICGTASLNGRDYPADVFRRDYAKYENRPVNCDHGRDATVERRFGWFTNVKPGPDGRPRGRLNCLKSHPMYERVMEAAERNPALFGFSHVAMCKTKPGPGGREVVEAIDEVESIDLVAEPATTKGFFEGRRVKTTLAKLIETQLPKLPPEKAKPLRKWLVLKEDDAAMGPVMGAEIDAPAEDADPNAAITAGFTAAIDAIVDQVLAGSLDWKTARKKCDKIFDSHGEATGSGKASPADGGEGDEPEPGKEGKKPTGANAILEAIDTCTAAQWTGYTREDLELVAAAQPDRRAKLVERLKGSPGGSGGPQSTGKSSIHPSLTAKGGTGTGTAKTSEAAPPTDGKAFAEAMK